METTELPDASIPVSCAWSLYPIGTPHYMEIIEQEIAATLESTQVKASLKHYCSRLDGSAGEVFITLRRAFDVVRSRCRHTVIHATISKGSPSKPGEQINLEK